MDMMEAPAAGAMPPEPEDEQEAGTELCIAIKADGSMEVYAEQDGQESDRRAVADIGQALKAVLDLYRSTQSAGEQQDFAQGFSRERDPAPGPMSGGR